MRMRSFWVCVLCAVCLAAGCRRGSQADKGGNTCGVLELGCLPADCFAAVVIHPQRLFQSPQAAGSAEVKKLLEGEGYQDLVKEIGFDFRDLEEATFLVFAPPSADKDVPEPAVVLRFARAIDRDQIIGKLARKDYTRSEQTHASKTYFKLSPPKERKYARPQYFFAPDDRTIVFVDRDEEVMQKMLAAKGAEGPLADALRRTDMNHEVVGAVVVEPVRALLGEALASLPPGAPAEFAEVKTLVGQVKGATLAGDLYGDPLAKATLQTDSPETAAKLLPIFQKGRELLLQSMKAAKGLRASSTRKPREGETAMEDLSAQFLDGLSFSQRESDLEAVVRIKNPELALWIIRGPIEARTQIRPILARLQVSNIRMGLHAYQMGIGSYPTTKQGLEALVKRPADLDEKVRWDGPYAESLEKDPWGRDYQFRFPAKRGNPNEPEVWSNGPDGKPDTPDDIGSWSDDDDRGPARKQAAVEKSPSAKPEELIESLPPLEMPKEPSKDLSK